MPSSFAVQKAHILENFDFEKVREAMAGMHWEWADGGIPTVEDMKRCVSSLIDDVILGYNTHIRLRAYAAVETGGFKAEIRNGEMNLYFVVTQCCGLDDDTFFHQTPDEEARDGVI